MRVVIPAAGSGSRFLPLSRVMPKELLPLGNLPVIHHALTEAERAGFEQAIIVLGPGKDSLRQYFDPDPELERKLEAKGDLETLERVREGTAIATRLKLLFVEQPAPLGLGDAVLRCRPHAPGATLAVLLPDDVIPGTGHWHRLLAAHAREGAAALCLREVPWNDTHRYGIAEHVEEGDSIRVTGLVEKPAPGTARSNLSILGRYIATEAVLESLANGKPGALGELQLTDGFAAAIESPSGVLGVRFEGELYDNGTPAEYASSVARYRMGLATQRQAQ